MIEEKRWTGADVVMFFCWQFCYYHKDKTINDALTMWGAIKANLCDRAIWFKNPFDYPRYEFLRMMKPVMEYVNKHKEFIGCNGKYNKK